MCAARTHTDEVILKDARGRCTNNKNTHCNLNSTLIKKYLLLHAAEVKLGSPRLK